MIDPRKGKVKQQKKNAHDGTKTSKCIFLKDGRIVTFGFSRMSDRQYALWDSRDLSGPMVMEDIDRASGVLFPFYGKCRKIFKMFEFLKFFGSFCYTFL